MVSTAPMIVTNTNAGKRPQNAESNEKSKPGHPLSGTPIQAASATLSKS